MKTFYFNIQSKGGAGKSMLTYIQALKNQNNQKSVFIDLDSSARTSTKQLSFLKESKRLIQIDLTDRIHKIEREKLFEVMESLNGMDFEEYFFDFGAPESQQFPSVFNFDFTAGEFKEFEKSLPAKFVFNIILSGGPAFHSCISYADGILKPLKGLFELYLYINDYTFQDQGQVVEEILAYEKMHSKLISGIKYFGNINVERNSGQRILESIKEGKGIESFTGFVTRTIIKREIARV